MRVCRKCSKQVDDDSKICRDCGAILEVVPDESLRGTDAEPERAFQSGAPLAAKPQEIRLGTGSEQSVGRTRATKWTCPQCGEAVPNNFDVCWKCFTTEEREKANQDELESLQETPDANEGGQEEPTEALGVDDDEKERPLQTLCARCGSSKMMHGVTVVDQGQHSDGQLKVVIFGDPSALIFKDRLYGRLQADICGDCGHVELRVDNPQELYRHYRKSLG